MQCTVAMLKNNFGSLEQMIMNGADKNCTVKGIVSIYIHMYMYKA